MVRKRRFSKLLLFAVMLSTIGAGVMGSVPLPVKAAEEEETYTVTFEAYEGTCETESITVPKGESIILPEASYEGHYLAGWVDAVDEGNMTTFRTIGGAGSEYTPERDLWLYANWKPLEEQDVTVIYEARIGDTSYAELEEAFANAQAGDMITVLKDCSVSATLEVTADGITMKSEDAGNPVTISRDEDFTGKSYGTDTDTVLLAVTGGSLITQDIIFDGGAVFDDDFNNSGKVWNSPLIYVDGSYVMESGAVLQNNYNTDGYVSSGSGRPLHTAGAVQIKSGGSFTMDGGLIQNCYTAQEMLGQTIAFVLKDKTVVSPANGTLEVMYPTGHAFAVRMKNGMGLLVHVGIDTVSLKGKGFKVFAKQGDTVKAGQKILEVDSEAIRAAGYDPTTMLIITEPLEEGAKVSFADYGEVKRGQKIH